MNAAFPFMGFGRRAADFFRNGTGVPQQPSQQEAQPPQRRQRNPPASKRAIRQLPTVVVAPEDLVDPNNRECCICLEENHLKARVTRLPCAHIFHNKCVVDWLNKSNTCPVCRYELVTDDVNYERTVRLERMQHRKPRYARYELQRMSIRELRQLSERLRVDCLTGCMEKSEMICRLVDSGRIDVIAAPEPVEYPLSLLRAMGIGELKRCMADAGVFFDPIDVVEKEDMVQIFIMSGRLVIVAETTVTETVEETSMAETAEESPPNEPLAETERLDSGDSISSRKRPVPSEGDETDSRTPIVTTVDEDSDDDDERATENRHVSSIDPDQLPQSNPLMEEIIPNGDVSSVSRDNNVSSANVMEDNLSRSVDDEVMEEDAAESGNAASKEGDTEDEPMDRISMENDTSATIEVADMEEEEETQDVETAYPVLVGRHASTGSDDVALVDDYSSAASTVEDSRFIERSISDLQALAREMRIDITDCIERSEIIGRLVSAAGRSDPRPVPDDFSSWSVSELRALAREVNVDLSNCKDRISMIAMLIEAANERPRVADYLSALMPLARLTVPQLRAVGREWQVNLYDCIEKEEMIHRLVIAGPSSS